ncbi:MAG TPA: aminoacyl-tRNA deacylase [Burkholderiaceae bacterium]|nr:aminoacyl-tRNA deacylase [Burkholderiaceae bacterium]
MTRERAPSTPANRALRAAGVAFSEHFYAYVEHGGTEVAARALGVEERRVLKTLVFEGDGRGLVVLMRGDREVSRRQLGRVLGLKRVELCAPQRAEKLSGYRVGGTSPFGLRTPMPVYVERSAIEDVGGPLFVNGGSRGYLVGLALADLVRVLDPTPVDVAEPPAA